jgi:hypothetical protein
MRLTRLTTMIEARERERMLRAHSIGPKMIAYLDEIGIKRLDDLVGADPEAIAMRIDIALGHKHINRLGVAALRNLIELAERECGQNERGR